MEFTLNLQDVFEEADMGWDIIGTFTISPLWPIIPMAPRIPWGPWHNEEKRRLSEQEKENLTQKRTDSKIIY